MTTKEQVIKLIQEADSRLIDYILMAINKYNRTPPEPTVGNTWRDDDATVAQIGAIENMQKKMGLPHNIPLTKGECSDLISELKCRAGFVDDKDKKDVDWNKGKQTPPHPADEFQQQGDANQIDDNDDLPF